MAEEGDYLISIVTRYKADMSAYWRDTPTFGDFVRLMRVRLALSKIGRWACPHPVTESINLVSFGREPVQIRSHTTDISVLNEVLVSGGYDGLLRHRPEDPRLIVDLGANTGLVDRWIINTFPGCRVVAVEPEPGNAAALRANVDGLPVRVIEAAIGAHARTVRLHTAAGEHAFTMVGEPTGTFVEVPVVTMDSVVTPHETIDLLKVDIEGAEEELFGDCANWITQVRMLLVECHGDYTLASLSRDLDRAGVRFRELEREENPGRRLQIGLFVRA